MEISSGVVLGMTAGLPAPHLETAPPVGTPLAALEQAVLPGLLRPPCLVSFSGGLDSSLVLAVASRVARREGLPLPVPVSWRFTNALQAQESGRQVAVVRALDLDDWSVLHADDDLDLVGPVARRLLLRHGVVHPANLHLHLPFLEAAAGGTALTGLGGDQMLSGWRPPGLVARGRANPRRLVRDLVKAVVVPTQKRDEGKTFPWLLPEVSAARMRDLAREELAEPRRLDRRMAWHIRRRDLALSVASMAAVAADVGAEALHPLLDPGFLAALSARAGRQRGAVRSRLLALIADGELPAVVTARRGKARFLEVFLRAPTHEFVSSWDGAGTDPALVDAAALRQAWSQWPIPGTSASLVQHLWLASRSTAPPAHQHPPPSAAVLETLA